jgi:hypothetical protein
MAVARCEECGPPKRKRRTYVHAHKLSSPLTEKFLCAEPHCVRQVSIIWLTDEEEQEYLKGVRSFRLTGRAGTVEVK